MTERPLEPDETLAAPTELASSDATTPQQIGPYRLLHRLGEGGMGEVWEAEQLEPVRRRVAVKVIKRGLDTSQVVARFEAERQALALMNHPNVAQVFDGGSMPDGRPFFAMEHVKGSDITTYCDRHRLDVRARIELFVQVCEGVQHAHQKAVVHRDLKPSNILVEDGPRPTPKIIDFGVAKATAQELTQKTLFTELGQPIGTLEYMAPEQADPTAVDIDTRADVYSLGVVLYELLSGSRPFESKSLRGVSLAEMQRMICEQDPPRPSTRVSSFGEDGTAVAERLQTDVDDLTRSLKGDLDWVVMKALEKDRARRYPSPSELAADLKRYLDDEPVAARPPSAGYRAAKFVRRHRLGVIASTLVALSILVGAGLALWQAVRATQAEEVARTEAAEAAQARDEMEAVVDFLVELFRVSDPNVTAGEELSAVEILDRGRERIEDELNDQPLVQARLQDTMGRAYRSLLRLPEAEEMLTAAVDQRLQLLGEGHRSTRQTQLNLANVYFSQSRYDEAAELYQALLEKHAAFEGTEEEEVRLVTNLGGIYAVTGRYELAEPMLREALEFRRRPGMGTAQQIEYLVSNLGVMMFRAGRYAESEPLLQEHLCSVRASLGDEHPRTLAAVNNLGAVYFLQDKFEQALPLYQEALAKRMEKEGRDHPRTAGTMNNLALLYSELGRDDEALPLAREAWEATQARLGEDHEDTLRTRDTLAEVLAAGGDLGQAELIYRDLVRRWMRLMGPKHVDTASTQLALGGLLLKRGESEEAESLLEQAVAVREEVLGPDHVETQEARDLLLVARELRLSTSPSP